MFDALGVGGGGSLIGGVAFLLAPIPFIFYKYGEPIRKRSKFAPTDDKPLERDPEVTEAPTGGSESNRISVDSTPELGTDRTVDSDVDAVPRSEDPEKDLEQGEV
jgi:hypothetical protein